MYKLYLFDDFEHITEHFMEQCIAVLPPERKEKAMRYRFEIDRKLSVISYLLLLYALRENYGINNPQIVYGRYGKPYLKDYPDIYFNISHCPKGCICAVSDREIGVDIQDIRPFSWNIAKRVCCERELKILQNATDKDKTFTKIWAMKESYLKMTGNGITDMLFADTTKLTNQIDVFENEDYVIATAVNHNLISGN
ncbi:MAG: 4'-phosphopantetheinyl transferase family protein [Porcipelethomonas sp.]